MSTDQNQPPAESSKAAESTSTQVEQSVPAEKPWWADQLGGPNHTYGETGRERKLSDIGG